jgi:hypothetical protein
MTERIGRMNDPRRAWLIGGILLLLHAVISPLLVASSSLRWLSSLGAISLAAALLVYGWGTPGGSVTARRPLGTGALTGLAVWILLVAVLEPLLIDRSASFDLVRTVSIVDAVVQLVAVLIAVIEIGRRAVVPRPWNWAPAWGLALFLVCAILSQTLGTLLLQNTAVDTAITIGQVFGVLQAAVPAFLGVVSIVLASRWRPSTSITSSRETTTERPR